MLNNQSLEEIDFSLDFRQINIQHSIANKHIFTIWAIKINLQQDDQAVVVQEDIPIPEAWAIVCTKYFESAWYHPSD